MDAPDRKVVLVALQVIANILLIRALVGDLYAKKNLKPITKLFSQFVNNLDATLVRRKRCARLSRVKVKVIGDRNARHTERDRKCRIHVNRDHRIW
jgi:hypothetical protein